MCLRFYRWQRIGFRWDQSLSTGTTVGTFYTYTGMRKIPTVTLQDLGSTGWTSVVADLITENGVDMTFLPAATGPTVRQLNYNMFLDAELK